MKRFALLSLALALAAATASPVARQAEDGWPRSVLITNDDGIDSEGLLALVRAFAPVATTYVVAPLDNRSGSTNYISAIAARSLELEPRDLGDGVTAFAVDGYPADAVALALNGLLDERPDLVISGINTGPNLAADWNISGTVGAAQIAAFFGVPALAISGFTNGEPETREAAARWVVELAHSPIARRLEPGGYLTISIPRVPVTEIEGVDVVRRGPRPWSLSFERAGAAAGAGGRERWTMRFVPQRVSPAEDTDSRAYSANRIAVVPMRVDEHDYELLRALREPGSPIPGWPPPETSR